MKALVLSLLITSAVPVAAFSQEEINTDAAAIESALYQGDFSSIGNHEVSGSVKIEKRGHHLKLTLSENFETTPGPDLKVVLRDSSGQASMQIIAPLKSSRGKQVYKLAMGEEDLQKFDEVVIYCEKFHVDFGAAKIR